MTDFKWFKTDKPLPDGGYWKRDADPNSWHYEAQEMKKVRRKFIVNVVSGGYRDPIDCKVLDD